MKKFNACMGIKEAEVIPEVINNGIEVFLTIKDRRCGYEKDMHTEIL